MVSAPVAAVVSGAKVVSATGAVVSAATEVSAATVVSVVFLSLPHDAATGARAKIAALVVTNFLDLEVPSFVSDWS